MAVLSTRVYVFPFDCGQVKAFIQRLGYLPFHFGCGIHNQFPVCCVISFCYRFLFNLNHEMMEDCYERLNHWYCPCWIHKTIDK